MIEFPSLSLGIILKINVQNIPDEGLLLDLLGQTIVLESQDIVVEGPISGKLSVQKAGGTDVHVRGSLSVPVRLSCGRCLRPFIYNVESEFYVDCTHEIKTGASAGHQEHRLYGEELNLHFYQGEMLDLSEIIAHQVYLETPMAPLCQEDCEGLCPTCREAFNTPACSCLRKTITQ